MRELVPGLAAGGDGRQDARLAQVLERALEGRLRDAGELRQVGGALGALGAGGGDEEAERLGERVLLGGAEAGDRLVEVALEDRLRAAELLERRQPQHRRAARRPPRPTAAAGRTAGARSRSGRAPFDGLVAPDVVEHPVDERRLDRGRPRRA